ncbi:MAG: 7-carboxy-7-deazaguanine synthase QueE [Planctomycetota bacterium]|nr:MAG: 7-carboxy-7-deazaguanine synthase QueE [Planctomycetota bacterium]
MQLAELFYSIQGEGRFVGTPSVFIRTSGCNLRCWFCDTPYTSWHPEGRNWSLDEILEWVCQYPGADAVVTGGEPMLVPDLVPLTHALRSRGHRITIETAGTIDLPVVADLMSISPKLGNSTPVGDEWAPRHDARRHAPAVIHRLTQDYDCQFKFVIDQPIDLEEVSLWLTEFPVVAPHQVYLMPQAITPEALREKSTWIRQAAAQRGWLFSPRLHIEMFGARRGV